MKQQYTVVHLFAGSGGCTLGFQRAGLRSLGSFDVDPKACRDLERLTGGPTFCADLQAMQPHELAAYTRGKCPDVVVGSPPCKSFSGCMPAARAGEERYVDMSLLAVWGVELALKAWAPRLPRLILLENVPQMATRGAAVVAQVTHLLRKAGYSVDVRSHCCGRKGGLAQRRKRLLIVARHVETCQDFLRQPPDKPLRTVGEVLGVLPSPAAAHGDEMHRLPLLSPLNWLRLAAIRAGRDWRDLPVEIVIGGERADPRKGWNPEHHAGRPDSYGVGGWEATSGTIRALQTTQTSRAAVADPRLAERTQRQNGGFGVEDFAGQARAVLGEGSVRNTPVSVADPRLGCEPRNGHYGVIDCAEASPTIIGHHQHDRAPASVADPRLGYSTRRGTFGVLDPDDAAHVIRGHHDVRQAPAAIVDPRGWPVPTHELVRGDDGRHVLYGPPLDLASTRPCMLVIRAPDGTWHRPMTDRELAVLQGFPSDCQLEGPSSSSKGTPGRREHIGNAIPAPAAEAFGREVVATLTASDSGMVRLLASGDVWVAPAGSPTEAYA